MTYKPKSKRLVETGSVQKKNILNGLMANKNIDDIKALANLSNSHSSEIKAIEDDLLSVHSSITDLQDSKQDKIKLTTTGSSGPATFVNNVLNIPQYSGGSLSVDWGSITGTLSDQTDLQTALNGKLNIPSGTTADYIDGTGALQVFPTLTSADKMVTLGRNSTGTTLYKGTIIYILGSTGNRPNYVKAQANAESTSAGTFGVVLDDIPNNSDGQAVTIGTIDNLDTRSSASHPFTTDTLIDGDTIYLSPANPGYVTRVKPSAPNHLVYIGKVVRTSPTNGTIVYRIQNGYELDEIHDVTTTNYTTPVDADSLLILDNSTSLWKRLTWANLKDTAKSYFDTLYQTIIPTGTTSQYYRGDKTWQTLDKSAVGLSNVDNTSDLNKPVSTAQASSIATKEPIITAGTTAQYWRGDKSWQTLDKSAVGLGNVDNTSDANKPISTATSTALSNKQDKLTLTTTGTSGAATLVGATLNIPQYSGGGSIYKLTSQTLTAASWTLSGSYYIYTFFNVNITVNTRVDFTPDNSAYSEVTTCGMLPEVDVFAGSCRFYSLFPPQNNITGEITIFPTI